MKNAAVALQESGFQAAFGQRRGTNHYARRPATQDDFMDLVRSLRANSGWMSRDQADAMASLFADARTQYFQIKSMLDAMARHMGAEALSSAGPEPWRALVERCNSDGVEADTVTAVLEFVANRSRRDRDREQPIFEPLIAAIGARYGRGDLPPIVARAVGKVLTKQPEYRSLADSLAARAATADPEARTALDKLVAKAEREDASKPLRELVAQLDTSQMSAPLSATIRRPAKKQALRQRHLTSEQRAEAVVEIPYLRGFAAGHPYIGRHMLDAGVDALTPWQHSDGHARQTLELLLGEIAAQPQHAQLVVVPDAPLHAVVIESLPEWDPPRPGNVTRRNEHVGIGIYVYDEDTDTWYKRGLHGRSRRDSVNRWPFATAANGLATAESYVELLLTGKYSAQEALGKGYPKRLAEANERLVRASS